MLAVVELTGGQPRECTPHSPGSLLPEMGCHIIVK